MTIVGDLTTETISLIFKECEKEKNKKRLASIINNITDIAIKNIQPYLYTIMAILVLLFVINCFQFYYYIKLFITSNNFENNHIEDIITKTL